MLNRRNMRIKAMHALYHKELDATLNVAGVIRKFDQSIDAVYHLYLFHLLALRELANYALIDTERIATRFTNTDIVEVVDKIVESPLIVYLNTPRCKLMFENERIPDLDENLTVKVLFNKLRKWQPFIDYNSKNPTPAEHENFLRDLYNQFLLSDEYFIQLTLDEFPNADDDDEIVMAQINISIRNAKKIDSLNNSFQLGKPDSRMNERMCYPIIKNLIAHESEFNQIIQPFLKNWDYDRVALHDILLMKMIITEWLYMPEVPVKVSLNEYLEIAKIYSTPKSIDFVNGIMDPLLKELKANFKIQKTGAGLIEN
jgi:N utilization substance protein B